MKKIFTLLFLTLSTAIFSATQYKDGLYVVKAEKPSYDWYSVIEITISNGSISKVEAEDYNIKNEKRTNDTAGNQYMKSKYGYDFKDVVANFTKKLTAGKNLSTVDALAGATLSNNIYKSLAEQALKKAETGSTDQSIINSK